MDAAARATQAPPEKPPCGTILPTPQSAPQVLQSVPVFFAIRGDSGYFPEKAPREGAGLSNRELVG
jgi:hypothetical protein